MTPLSLVVEEALRTTRRVRPGLGDAWVFSPSGGCNAALLEAPHARLVGAGRKARRIGADREERLAQPQAEVRDGHANETPAQGLVPRRWLEGRADDPEVLAAA